MSLWALLALSLALSADAFAVSISTGMSNSIITKKHCLITALTFGLFQAAMPIAGFYAGVGFSDLISSFDHYVAFILLALIGVKMIVESIKKENMNKIEKKNFSYKSLIFQGIATSIDALAVGVSLSVVNVNIALSSTIIGSVTFAVCLLGILMGRKIGSLMGKRAEFLGGVVLIIIGINILIEGLL